MMAFDTVTIAVVSAALVVAGLSVVTALPPRHDENVPRQHDTSTHPTTRYGNNITMSVTASPELATSPHPSSKTTTTNPSIMEMVRRFPFRISENSSMTTTAVSISTPYTSVVPSVVVERSSQEGSREKESSENLVSSVLQSPSGTGEVSSTEKTFDVVGLGTKSESQVGARTLGGSQVGARTLGGSQVGARTLGGSQDSRMRPRIDLISSLEDESEPAYSYSEELHRSTSKELPLLSLFESFEDPKGPTDIVNSQLRSLKQYSTNEFRIPALSPATLNAIRNLGDAQDENVLRPFLLRPNQHEEVAQLATTQRIGPSQLGKESSRTGDSNYYTDEQSGYQFQDALSDDLDYRYNLESRLKGVPIRSEDIQEQDDTPSERFQRMVTALSRINPALYAGLRLPYYSLVSEEDDLNLLYRDNDSHDYSIYESGIPFYSKNMPSSYGFHQQPRLGSSVTNSRGVHPIRSTSPRPAITQYGLKQDTHTLSRLSPASDPQSVQVKNDNNFHLRQPLLPKRDNFGSFLTAFNRPQNETLHDAPIDVSTHEETTPDSAPTTASFAENTMIPDSVFSSTIVNNDDFDFVTKNDEQLLSTSGQHNNANVTSQKFLTKDNTADIITLSSNVEISYAPPPRAEPLPASLPLISLDNSGELEHQEPSKEIPVYIDPNASVFGYESSQITAKPHQSQDSNKHGPNDYKSADYDYYEEYYDYNIATPISVSRSLALDSYPPNDIVSTMSTIFSKDQSPDLGNIKNSNIRQNPLFQKATPKENQHLGGTHHDELGSKNNINDFPTNSRNIFQPHLQNVVSSNGRSHGQDQASQLPINGQSQDIITNTSPNSQNAVGPIPHLATTHPSNDVTEATDGLSSYSSYTYESILDELLATTPGHLNVNTLLAPITARPNTDLSRLFGAETLNSQLRDTNSGKDFHSQKVESNEGFIDSNSRGEFGLGNENNEFQASLSSDDPSAFTPVLLAEASTVRNPIVSHFSTPFPLPKPPLLSISDDPNLQYLNRPNPPSRLIRLSQHPKSFLPFPYPKAQFPHLSENFQTTPSANLGINPLFFNSHQSTPNTFLTNDVSIGNHIGLEHHEKNQGVTFTPEAESNYGWLTPSASSDIFMSASIPTRSVDLTYTTFSTPLAPTASTHSFDAVTGLELLKNNFPDDYYETSESKAIFPSDMPIANNDQGVLSQRGSSLNPPNEGYQHSETGGPASSFLHGSYPNLNTVLADHSPESHSHQSLDHSLKIQSNLSPNPPKLQSLNILGKDHSNIHADIGNILQQSSTNEQLVNAVSEQTLSATTTEQSTDHFGDKLHHKHFNIAAGERDQLSSNPQTIGTTASFQNPRYFSYPDQFRSNNGYLDANSLPVYPAPLYPSGQGGFISPQTFGKDFSQGANYPLQQEQFYYQQPFLSQYHQAILPPQQQYSGYASNYYLGIPTPNSPFYNMQNPMFTAASFNGPYPHNLNPSLYPYQHNYAKQLHPLSFVQSSLPNSPIGDHLISQSLHLNDEVSTTSNTQTTIPKTKIESLPVRSLKEIIIDDQGRLVEETFYEDNIFEDSDVLDNSNVQQIDNQDYEQDDEVTSKSPKNSTKEVHQKESNSDHGTEQSLQLQTLSSQITSSPLPTTFRPSISFLDTSSQSLPWVPIAPITQVEGKSVLQTNTPDILEEIVENTTAGSVGSSTNSHGSPNFIEDFIAVTPIGANGLIRPTTTETTPKVNLSTIAELVRPVDKPVNNEISAFTTLREALRGIAHHPSYFMLPNEDNRNSTSAPSGEPSGKILLNANPIHETKQVSGDTPKTKEFVLILSENDLGILPNAGDYRIVLPDTFSNLGNKEELEVAETVVNRHVTPNDSKERLSQITQHILQGKDNVDLNFLKGQSSVGQVYTGKIELQQQTVDKDLVRSEKSADGTKPQREIDLDGVDAVEINDVIKFLESNLGKLADESREMLRQRFAQGNEEIHLDTPIYLWRPGFKKGFGMRLLDNMHFVIPNIPENYGKPVPFHEIPRTLEKLQKSTRDQPVTIRNSGTTFSEELQSVSEDASSENITKNSIREQTVKDLDEAKVPLDDLYQYDYTESGSDYYDYDYKNANTDTNTKQSVTSVQDTSRFKIESVVKDQQEKSIHGIQEENSTNHPNKLDLSVSSNASSSTHRPIEISTVRYIMPSVADNFVSELEKLFQFASSNSNLQVAAPDPVETSSKATRENTSLNKRVPSVNTLKNDEHIPEPNEPFYKLIKSANHSTHFFSSPEILNNIVNLTSQNNLTFINRDDFNSDLNLGIKGLPSSANFKNANSNLQSHTNAVKSMTSSELRDWNNAIKLGADNPSYRGQNANSQVLKLYEQILLVGDDEDESSTSQALIIDPSKSNNQIFVSSNVHMSPFPVFDEKFFTQESSKHIVQVKKDKSSLHNSSPDVTSQQYFLPDNNVQIPSSAAEYFEKQRESNDFSPSATTTLSSNNIASGSVDPMQNTLKLLNLNLQQITKPLFVPVSNQESHSGSNHGIVHEKLKNEMLNNEIGLDGRPIESQISKIPIQSSTESILYFVPNIIPSNRKEIQTNPNDNSKRDWLWDTDSDDLSKQSEVEVTVTKFQESDFVPVPGPFGARELFVPSKLTREQLDLLLAGGLEASEESEEILLSSSSENRPPTINRHEKDSPAGKLSENPGVHRVMKLSEVLQQHPEVIDVSHETKSSALISTGNRSKSLNPLGGSTRDGWRWFSRTPHRSGAPVGDFNDTSGVHRQTNNEKTFIRGFHSTDRRTTLTG